jgi:hypothetical protein
MAFGSAGGVRGSATEPGIGSMAKIRSNRAVVVSLVPFVTPRLYV